MRGARSHPGESTTTNNVRTAVWDTKHRKSSRRRRQPASTQLSERQGTQTPSLAPRAPPSRLQPRMEKQKAVVFLRERIWGAGHPRMQVQMPQSKQPAIFWFSGCRQPDDQQMAACLNELYTAWP